MRCRAIHNGKEIFRGTTDECMTHVEEASGTILDLALFHGEYMIIEVADIESIRWDRIDRKTYHAFLNGDICPCAVAVTEHYGLFRLEIFDVLQTGGMKDKFSLNRCKKLVHESLKINSK